MKKWMMLFLLAASLAGAQTVECVCRTNVNWYVTLPTANATWQTNASNYVRYLAERARPFVPGMVSTADTNQPITLTAITNIYGRPAWILSSPRRTNELWQLVINTSAMPGDDGTFAEMTSDYPQYNAELAKTQMRFYMPNMATCFFYMRRLR